MSSGNGHDPATKQMVEVLLRIETGLKGLNARVDVLHEDNVGLTARVDVLATRVEALTTRADLLHDDMLGLRADVTGVRNEMRSLRPELNADLEGMRERIARLEAAVFKPAAE